MLKETKKYSDEDMVFMLDLYHKLTKDVIVNDADFEIIKATLFQQIEVRNRSDLAVDKFSSHDENTAALAKRDKGSQGSCNSSPEKRKQKPSRSTETFKSTQLTEHYELTPPLVKRTSDTHQRIYNASKSKDHLKKPGKMTKSDLANMPPGLKSTGNPKRSCGKAEPELELVLKPQFLSMFDIAKQVAVVSDNKESEVYWSYCV
jgi:hypothetical protein